MASSRLVIVGGGPAGLMAAEVARAAGLQVDVFEGKGSVGRKFLIAGKGGLNLTHSEPLATFTQRFGARHQQVALWLAAFDADALREWARGLGVETFIGTSGRVFPVDLKAAPLLRGWVRRLRESGVRFHVQHYCTGFAGEGALHFRTPEGERVIDADAVIFAMGGGSWPQLGSDGAWCEWLSAKGAEIAPLQPSNCGFDIGWSEHFSGRFAGAPIKPVVISWMQADGTKKSLQGECVATATGIEGSLVYALSAQLRDAIAADGQVEIQLDLAPGRDLERLRRELARPRNGRSISEHLRRSAGIEGVKAGLLHERVAKADMADAERLAVAIKSLPLTLLRPRPMAEAISTAGGVRFEAVDEHLMLRCLPGVFCAGEMLDWEAPTGGYLLAASMAGGKMAAEGAIAWLSNNSEGNRPVHRTMQP